MLALVCGLLLYYVWPARWIAPCQTNLGLMARLCLKRGLPPRGRPERVSPLFKQSLVLKAPPPDEPQSVEESLQRVPPERVEGGAVSVKSSGVKVTVRPEVTNTTSESGLH